MTEPGLNRERDTKAGENQQDLQVSLQIQNLLNQKRQWEGKEIRGGIRLRKGTL